MIDHVSGESSAEGGKGLTVGLVGMGGVYRLGDVAAPRVHMGFRWLEIGGVESLDAARECLGVVGCWHCWMVGTGVVTWQKEAGCMGQAVSPPVPRVGC